MNYFVGDHPQGYTNISLAQKWASNRVNDIQFFFYTFKKQDAYGFLVNELAQTLFPTLEFDNIDFFKKRLKFSLKMVLK